MLTVSIARIPVLVGWGRAMQVLRVQDEAVMVDALQRGLTAAGFEATV